AHHWMMDSKTPFNIPYKEIPTNRLKSTNLIERLNQEVRRREKNNSHLPQSNIIQSLIGAVLMDLHDEWIYSSRKYINFDK
ncbi:hypothetical protein DBN76_01520, partial [Enterococcus faecalis]|nr:hypothetical protein [Enterococcus faecalis]